MEFFCVLTCATHFLASKNGLKEKQAENHWSFVLSSTIKTGLTFTSACMLFDDAFFMGDK